MEIFDTALPTQALAAQKANQSKGRINFTFATLVKSYKREFDAFWRDPQCTPQQMAEAWGTDCLELFTNSGETCTYILTIDPDALPVEYQTPLMPYQPEIVDGQATGRIIVSAA